MRNIDVLAARRGAESAGGKGGDDFSPPLRLRSYQCARFPGEISSSRFA